MPEVAWVKKCYKLKLARGQEWPLDVVGASPRGIDFERGGASSNGWGLRVLTVWAYSEERVLVGVQVARAWAAEHGLQIEEEY